MKLDQEPRLPGLPAALIDWARAVVKNFNQLFDQVQTHEGQISALQTTVGQGWQTGDFKFSARTSIPLGWLSSATATIGNVASGAVYANADAQALFTLWWTEFTNAQLPILTSAGGASTRGASAAADWAALKRLTVPSATDRYIRASGTNAPTTLQADSIRNHQHSDWNVPASSAVPGAGLGAIDLGSGRVTSGGNMVGAGTETRPVTLVLQGFWKL